jgi:hypothetical protein
VIKEVAPSPLQPTPENRWGLWVTGFGDFVNVDNEGSVEGYNFTTGGKSKKGQKGVSQEWR